METELTQEQIDKCPLYVKKWVDIGLSTEPVDRELAEKAINQMYECGKVDKPKKIVWFKSPLSMYIGIHEVMQTRKLNWDTLYDRVKDINVINDPSYKDAIGGYLNETVYGNHEAGWLSFYDFFETEFPEKYKFDNLVGLNALSKTCGWVFPRVDVCFASERHTILNRDEEGRLHCEDGPAVSYSDGWSVYAVHGVRVPEYIIMRPEEITLDKIRDQPNAEVRRVMIGKFGEGRYIEESGAVMIHKDKYGELYKAEIEGDEPLVMVRFVNSTPEPDGTSKIYFKRVPPDEEHDELGIIKGPMLRAKQATAWTFRVPEDKYNPLIET